MIRTAIGSYIRAVPRATLREWIGLAVLALPMLLRHVRPMGEAQAHQPDEIASTADASAAVPVPATA